MYALTPPVKKKRKQLDLNSYGYRALLLLDFLFQRRALLSKVAFAALPQMGLEALTAVDNL
jgi:hypothetical protein